jgi:PIN domain nuclease of toxin-antitoxin system
VALWSIAEPHKLNSRAKSALKASSSDFYLSSASVWEIAIKYALGNLRLHTPPRAFVTQLMSDLRLQPLPIVADHAIEAGELPRIHEDPFDRMLIAQARIEGMSLLTADRTIMKYDVETIQSGL